VSGPSGVTPPASPGFGVTRLVVPAARTRLPAAVSVGTGRTRPVAPRAVPAGLAGVAGAVGVGAEPAVFTETTAERERGGGGRERGGGGGGGRRRGGGGRLT